MSEYIERKTAIDAITTDGFEHFSGCLSSSEVTLIELMCDTISEIPAADVVPVVYGEWIDDPRPYYGAKQYVCDQCSEDEYWRKRRCCFKENFCPNCGAKMKGE